MKSSARPTHRAITVRLPGLALPLLILLYVSADKHVRSSKSSGFHL